jgi:hypothetical protein
VQVPGEGIFLSSAVLQGFMEREPLLLRTLLLYVQALATQIALVRGLRQPPSDGCALWPLASANPRPCTRQLICANA